MNKKPNIIFILSDDQGAWALGTAGNKEIHTPNLDKLAHKGIRFENFFCASPVCSPARASIITGEMPSCHGVLDWLRGGNIDTERYPDINSKFGTDISIEYLKGHTSYIEKLADNGYTCAHSGKWHLGASDTPKIGFSNWFSLLGGGCEYFKPTMCEHGSFCEYERYVTDVITDKALDYLDVLTKQEKPFYLSVHYTAPHSPWGRQHHQKEFLDLYEDCLFNSTPDVPIHQNQIKSAPVGDTEQNRRAHLTGYYAAITAMDSAIGKILDALNDSEKSNDTIIIFTSDNGMNMGHHGVWGKGNGTYPPNMYDTSVKVPFIIYSPNTCNAGSVNTNLHSHVDIFPTIMEMCGIDYTHEKLSGTSFYEEINDKELKAEQRDIIISSEYGFVRMLRTKTRKLILDYKYNSHQYYDLESDVDEVVNLYDNPLYQHEILELKRRLSLHFEKYSVPQNSGVNYNITGQGQKRLCHNTDAFVQNIEHYHGKRRLDSEDK